MTLHRSNVDPQILAIIFPQKWLSFACFNACFPPRWASNFCSAETDEPIELSSKPLPLLQFPKCGHRPFAQASEAFSYGTPNFHQTSGFFLGWHGRRGRGEGRGGEGCVWGSDRLRPNRFRPARLTCLGQTCFGQTALGQDRFRPIWPKQVRPV